MNLIQVETVEDIHKVEQIAAEIWREHYPTMISHAQIDYMLETLQSETAIQNQKAIGVKYYFIMENSEVQGYIAIDPDKHKHSLFISKFYLLKPSRGKGYARSALDEIERMANHLNLKSLHLTVNKRNYLAIDVYQKLGFSISGEIINPIGNGFFMDDYQMSKHLNKFKFRQVQ